MSVVPRIVLRLYAACLVCAAVSAQAFQGAQLDVEGKGAEARAIFQKAVDSAATPAAKANAQRNIAMSWAFEANCAKTGEYERMVIDYWATREKDDPGNAFYQEGEMADEAARVCIESGDLDAAAEWYKQGHELGLKEPNLSLDRKALWDFRWQHAQARIAARRGNRVEAEQHIAAAKSALDKMTELRAQQQAFLPYLTGYVAFYLGDYKTALADLQKAQNDPFIQCLLAQTYEKLGDQDKAMEYYRKAAGARGHNPPAAYAIPFAKRKLNQTRS
jgi:tetratricopeptide (TPR) repeat protein